MRLPFITPETTSEAGALMPGAERRNSMLLAMGRTVPALLRATSPSVTTTLSTERRSR